MLGKLNAKITLPEPASAVAAAAQEAQGLKIFRREDIDFLTDPSELVVHFPNAAVIEIGARSAADLIEVETASGEIFAVAVGRPSPVGAYRGPFKIRIGNGTYKTDVDTPRNYFLRPASEVRRRYKIPLELYFWRQPGAVTAQRRAPMIYQLPAVGSESLAPTVAVQRLTEFPVYGRHHHMLKLFANDQILTYNVRGITEAAGGVAFEHQLYPAAGNATLAADSWIALVFEGEQYDRIELNGGQAAGGDTRWHFETRDL